MFLFRLLSFLTGFVTIEVIGYNIEKFINKAASRGILLWNIRRLDENKLRFQARLSAVHPLRHLARQHGCRLKFGQRGGWPFIWSKMRRRKAFLTGIIVFFLGLYVLSGFVWFVEVQGNEQLSSRVVKELAGQAGLRPGVWRKTLDVRKLENSIKEQLPQVSWVGVRISGIRAYIQVAEKKLPPVASSGPAHVVAVKAGLVKEVLVINGNQVVNEGEAVTAGQVLISGIVPATETGQDVPGDVTRAPLAYVRARGIVRARVWYEAYGETPVRESITAETGREYRRYSIKIRDRVIMLAGQENIPFRYFRCDEEVKKLAGRNIKLPVEIISQRYLELEKKVVSRTHEQALSLAQKRAMADLYKQLPPQVQPLALDVEEVKGKNPEDVVRVHITAETCEDIGMEKAFVP
ncbi:sporulation protein YqfD [Desulfurispora thermophila]|uniref:sporulation protein YqfD n=1 Tax=Desulfurispora thermophila TaxID=265470 RepID=UPI00036ADFE3|nr:sporulation protein YqfD [Desulfurispora thermophila]